MKLRNKKTGKVVEWFNNTDGIFPNTLAELNEEWEDVPEEPEEFYYITGDGYIATGTFITKGICRYNKEIGNYFETKEEAERAVEKLEAWKRLKDKGFRFVGITETSLDMDCVEFEIGKDFYKEQSIRNSELNKDLDLLFGGEE